MLLSSKLKLLACCNSVSTATSYTFAFNIIPKYPLSSRDSPIAGSSGGMMAVDLYRFVFFIDVVVAVGADAAA